MPGPSRALILSLTTLLCCGCVDAFAAEPTPKRPLQLKLMQTPLPVPAAADGQLGGAPRTARLRTTEASLGERALDSLLDDADRQATSPAPASGTFNFKRRGNAGRDLAQGYNNMCEAVSRKVWDDPNGRRIKFDVAGKPGVGIEIPLR